MMSQDPEQQQLQHPGQPWMPSGVAVPPFPLLQEQQQQQQQTEAAALAAAAAAAATTAAAAPLPSVTGMIHKMKTLRPGTKKKKKQTPKQTPMKTHKGAKSTTKRSRKKKVLKRPGMKPKKELKKPGVKPQPDVKPRSIHVERSIKSVLARTGLPTYPRSKSFSYASTAGLTKARADAKKWLDSMGV